MFYFLVSVNIIAIILMLFMLAICLRKKLSKAQLAFIIYDIFSMLFVVGEFIWNWCIRIPLVRHLPGCASSMLDRQDF